MLSNVVRLKKVLNRDTLGGPSIKYIVYLRVELIFNIRHTSEVGCGGR